MPVFVGMFFAVLISPLLYFAGLLFLVALLAKAFSFGTGTPLIAVCIAFTVILSAWHLRLPLRDAVRAHKGLPRTGYPRQYYYAVKKTLLGCGVMYVVYLAAGKLPF